MMISNINVKERPLTANQGTLNNDSNTIRDGGGIQISDEQPQGGVINWNMPIKIETRKKPRPKSSVKTPIRYTRSSLNKNKRYQQIL